MKQCYWLKETDPDGKAIPKGCIVGNEVKGDRCQLCLLNLCLIQLERINANLRPHSHRKEG